MLKCQGVLNNNRRLSRPLKLIIIQVRCQKQKILFLKIHILMMDRILRIKTGKNLKIVQKYFLLEIDQKIIKYHETRNMKNSILKILKYQKLSLIQNVPQLKCNPIPQGLFYPEIDRVDRIAVSFLGSCLQQISNFKTWKMWKSYGKMINLDQYK